MNATEQIKDVISLLQIIESNEPETWHEIKHLIYEQYHEVKEPWLVQMLYDLYSKSESSRCLELLLNVREHHDKFLCDSLACVLKGKFCHMSHSCGLFGIHACF